MAVSSMHVLHGIVNSSTFISQIGSSTSSPGIQTMVGHAAGLVNPLFVANMSQNPGVAFQSSQIKTLLDLTGVTIEDLSGANTDLLFKACTDGAARVADATTGHIRLRAANAVLDLSSITAGHNSEAVASCRLICYYDGTNEPIVPAGSVALSGTPTSAEHFVAGPVFLDLTGSARAQLTGIQDITVDFGRTLIEVGGDGELYITFVAEGSVEPTITVRGFNVPWASFGLNGSSFATADVFLRKMARTGRVANATQEHIQFAAAAGYVYVSESAAGNNEGVITTVTIKPIASSASTTALTVDTTAAIA